MDRRLTLDIFKHPLPNYLRQLQAERQLSTHTVTNYSRDIEQFISWFESAELESIDERSINYYLFYLSQKKLSPSSISRKLSALRQYANFLVTRGIIKNNPITSIRAPKQTQKLPKALGVDTLNQLLDKTAQTIDLSDGLAVRDWAMIELLYTSGVRVAEMTGLNLTDIDWENKQMRIKGKGGKMRQALIGQSAEKAIKNWLQHRQTWLTQIKNKQKGEAPENPMQSALFINQQGKRLSIRSVQLRINAWGKAHDVNLNLHPHLFRHSFASHLLQSSGDLRAVQELLGHSDISSTQIYTHLDFQHLAKVYDQAHPRAKKANANQTSNQPSDQTSEQSTTDHKENQTTAQNKKNEQ